MFKLGVQFLSRIRSLSAGLLIALSVALPATAAPITLLPNATERAATAPGSAAAIPTTHRIAVSSAELAAMQPGQSFSLSIPGHSGAFEIVYDRSESALGSVSWVGHLKGDDNYRAIITTDGVSSAGRITTPEGNFHIESSGGVTTLTDLDRGGFKFKDFGNDSPRPNSPALAAKLAAMAASGKLPSQAAAAATPIPQSAMSAPSTPTASAAGSSGNTTIDVMVLYNPSLAAFNASTIIANLIAVANQAMIDSGVAITFRVVNTTQLNMSDTDSNQTLLNKVTYSSDPTGSGLINDPVYAGVATLRAQ